MHMYTQIVIVIRQKVKFLSIQLQKSRETQKQWLSKLKLLQNCMLFTCDMRMMFHENSTNI